MKDHLVTASDEIVTRKSPLPLTDLPGANPKSRLRRVPREHHLPLARNPFRTTPQSPIPLL